MTDFPIRIAKSDWDFSEVHDSLARYVHTKQLPMVSTVILRGKDVIDYFQVGDQDREAGIPLAPESIFRIFSNTKLITSVAAMILWERGQFQLDDRLVDYIPEFTDLKVVREGSSDATEVEDLESFQTIRQLVCHNAGFSYGIFQESIMDPLYGENRILSPKVSLEETMVNLARIPLAYQPGKRFQYSVSTDVLARVIELLSGKPFGEFLKQEIFEPLGMVDTDFHVPGEKVNRFCAIYGPPNVLEPMEGECQRTQDMFGDYTRVPALESGGGGLVSTIVDYTRFIQMLVGGGSLDGIQIIQPETLKLMRQPQLPDGIHLQLPDWEMSNTSFGIGFAVKQAPAEGEPDTAVGEYHWGGLAGTHSWISPKAGISGICFTQRMQAFWHPYSHDFKRRVYATVS